jgi:HK97 gp10 family phage protein
MADITISVDTSGLRRLREQIRSQVEAGVARVAHEIEEDARRRAPVRTGFLRSSIEAIPSDAAEPGTVEWEVGAAAPYGIFVELGTTKMAARPFLTPAAEAGRGPFLDAVGDALQKLTEEV